MTLHQGTERSTPLGASIVDGGVNFSLFSRHATGVELLFFDRDDDAKPSRVVTLDPVVNRTYHYWHVFVPAVRPGQLYGYRVSRAVRPGTGLRFDPAKVLLDPYGRGVVVPEDYSREAAGGEGDNAATAMKSVVVDPRVVRLGRRRAAAAALFPYDHLRDARGRLHTSSELRRG